MSSYASLDCVTVKDKEVGIITAILAFFNIIFCSLMLLAIMVAILYGGSSLSPESRIDMRLTRRTGPARVLEVLANLTRSSYGRWLGDTGQVALACKLDFHIVLNICFL